MSGGIDALTHWRPGIDADSVGHRGISGESEAALDQKVRGMD